MRSVPTASVHHDQTCVNPHTGPRVPHGQRASASCIWVEVERRRMRACVAVAAGSKATSHNCTPPLPGSAPRPLRRAAYSKKRPGHKRFRTHHTPNGALVHGTARALRRMPRVRPPGSSPGSYAMRQDNSSWTSEPLDIPWVPHAQSSRQRRPAPRQTSSRAPHVPLLPRRSGRFVVSPAPWARPPAMPPSAVPQT